MSLKTQNKKLLKIPYDNKKNYASKRDIIFSCYHDVMPKIKNFISM